MKLPTLRDLVESPDKQISSIIDFQNELMSRARKLINTE